MSEATFGYHPDKLNLDAALSSGEFVRGLVLDMTVRTVVDAVGETRFLREPEVELPEGRIMAALFRKCR